MIRWDEQPNRDWCGFSGEVVVATVKQDAPGRWTWEVTGTGKLKGNRSSGHRTSEVDARRAAEVSWQRWLDATALKPDLMTLAEMSLPKTRARKASEAGRTEDANGLPDEQAPEMERLRHRADLAEAHLAEERQRRTAAEERADAAEARLQEIETSARERLDRIRAIAEEDGP